MKKILSVILSIIMISSLLPTAFAAENETVILYTNDIHCAIDNYPLLAAYRADLIAQGKEVITVDAGDAIQGALIGRLTNGEAVVDIMNAVGYDYAVPGNHEFDYGMDVFLDLARNKAEYKYISSNFHYLPSVSPVFAPYAIEDFGDYQVAFVGISTPETITQSTAEFFKDENNNFIYSFPIYPGGMTNEDLYDNVQESVDYAIKDGADIVVAIGHTGILEITDGWKSNDIIANTEGIDYYIDAHSHEITEKTTYENKNGADVTLTSAGSNFNHFGVMTISGNRVDFKLVKPNEINIETMSAKAKTAYNTVKEKVDKYNNYPHEHSYTDGECICGIKKADYSGYSTAINRYNNLFEKYKDVLTDSAKDNIMAEIDNLFGDNSVNENYSRDEQYILDDIISRINYICDAFEAGIENETFIKPDYTKIEEKIVEFERTHTDENSQKFIEEIKAELAKIKDSDPESAAEIKDDLAAFEEKIEKAEKCQHIYHNNNWFFSFIWKIANFFRKLFNLNPVCDCGIDHYQKKK